tara:strand:+ start:19215 stop:19403 length:189 start_codon:yes stop_codon:yes gene_type:complete
MTTPLFLYWLIHRRLTAAIGSPWPTELANQRQFSVPVIIDIVLAPDGHQHRVPRLQAPFSTV